MIRRRHPIHVLIGFVFLISVFALTLLTTRSEQTSATNVLQNGDFEGGFRFVPACGMVATGWGCFTNDDAAIYGAVADVWPPVVQQGRYSQLLSINIRQPGIPPNRVIGIYQTVSLVPGQTYTLQLNGIIRAGDNDPDPWRYRVEWGYTLGADTDWQHVSRWQELPWNTYDAIMSPGPFRGFSTTLRAPAARITLFVRLRAKWGTWPRQVVVNLDNLSLYGPAPQATAVTSTEQPSGTPTPSGTSETTATTVSSRETSGASTGGTCSGPNLLVNGGFEDGFEQGVVARGWTFFTNNELASYSFHDDPNFSLGAEDLHGQFIGINTQGFRTSTPARYAGIAQTVKNLTAGETYQLCLWGIVKMGLPVPVEDAKEFRAEWALVPGEDVKPDDVKAWNALPWPLEDWEGKTVYSYTVSVVAPSDTATLFIRLWKESAAVDQEGDLILRAVHLGPRPPQPAAPGCTYTVQPGDTLGAIALAYGTTVSDLVRINNLDNPDLIFVGQTLQVPCTQAEGKDP